MSDEEVVLVRDTEAAQGSLSRLVKTIENWALKESDRNDFELAAFSSVLAEGVVKFENIPQKDCKACPGLTKAIGTVHKHLTKEHHRFDQEIDKLHVHFAKKMEELDEIETFLSTGEEESYDIGDLKNTGNKTFDKAAQSTVDFLESAATNIKNTIKKHKYKK